jgi:ribosomal protein S18 acetylase RimI-like enzyme
MFVGMPARSLGFRTDLTLLQFAGSEVEDRGSHLVVRTRENPSYFWGNFVLLKRPPAPGSGRDWLALFTREFPAAQHRAFGVDVDRGGAEDLTALVEAGPQPQVSTVLTARAVSAPVHPNRAVEIRPLRSSHDWTQRVDLTAAVNSHLPMAPFREFATRKADAERRLVEDGHGTWLGAFAAGRLVGSLGVFGVGDGLGRFQSVETHPDARRRGVAGTLVHAASRHALETMGLRTLVMVADPQSSAIRIYRSLGFTDSGFQLKGHRLAAQ